MHKFLTSRWTRLACVAFVSLVAACSPKFDWREVRGTNAPFVVLLPAKPASHTRTVNLDGLQVPMTMTAADVDGVTFAVGTAELPDAAQAARALAAMKTALVRNIGGTIRQEKTSVAGAVSATIDIEASGGDRLLIARFLSRDKRIYQVIMVGKESAVSREAVDTFFTSFKLN
jgi:hypothetical protein